MVDISFIGDDEPQNLLYKPKVGKLSITLKLLQCYYHEQELGLRDINFHSAEYKRKNQVIQNKTQ